MSLVTRALAMLGQSARLAEDARALLAEHAQLRHPTPTLSEFVLREPLKAIPLHGPGSPCCDAYGADRVATHDGSTPEAPTALPFCAEEE